MTSDFLAQLAEWVKRVADALTAVFRVIADRLAELLKQAQRLLDQLSEPPAPGYRIERWPRWRAPLRVNPGRGLSSAALGRPPYLPRC